MHDTSCRCRPYDDDSLYTINVDPHDIQCIAPIGTRGHPRCRHRLAGTDIDDVRSLHATITTSQDAAEILGAVRELILSQCCQAGTHRAKLEAETSCRAALVEALLLKLAEEDLLQTVVLGTELEPEEGIGADGVVKYHDTSALLLADVLRSDVDLSPKSRGEKELPRSGVIYALSLPSLPKLVKIGFSGKTAESRRLEWTNCFPGAAVLIERTIAYPERMEQLMHLQLAKQRRQIAKCKTCSKTHIELFEMSGDDAKQLIDEWQSLADDEPIYDSMQRLTAVYSSLLDEVTEELTANTLIKMLTKRAIDAEVKTLIKTELGLKEELEPSTSGQIEPGSRVVPLHVKQESTGSTTQPAQANLPSTQEHKSNTVARQRMNAEVGRDAGVVASRELTAVSISTDNLTRAIELNLDEKKVQVKIEEVELPSTLPQHEDKHIRAEPQDKGNLVKQLTDRIAVAAIEQSDEAEKVVKPLRTKPVLIEPAVA